MEKPRIDLTLGEADTFSASGFITKRMRELPAGVHVGADVQIGHWSAECASIEHRGDELQQVFVVGFRMRF